MLYRGESHIAIASCKVSLKDFPCRSAFMYLDLVFLFKPGGNVKEVYVVSDLPDACSIYSGAPSFL
jgi:hypothetical protein